MQLVFDIGGTKTRLAVSNDGQSLGEVVSLPTHQAWEEELIEIRSALPRILGQEKIDDAAGCIAGVFDQKKTKLVKSPHLPDWEGKLLKKDLEKIFGSKVILANDAVMEGIGEAVCGAGRRKQIVAYISIGTGIGGAKIVDGKPGITWWGYEPGHQIIDVDGKMGYFEEFASGTAITRITGQDPEEITDPEIWENEERILAVGIHNLIVMWSPEIVIMGGGVTNKINLDRLRSLLEEEMTIFPKLPLIVKSELGEKSGLYGALSLISGRQD